MIYNNFLSLIAIQVYLVIIWLVLGNPQWPDPCLLVFQSVHWLLTRLVCLNFGFNVHITLNLILIINFHLRILTGCLVIKIISIWTTQEVYLFFGVQCLDLATGSHTVHILQLRNLTSHLINPMTFLITESLDRPTVLSILIILEFLDLTITTLNVFPTIPQIVIGIL